MSTCPICFTTFIPRTRIQETCSTPCSLKNRERKYTQQRRAAAAMKTNQIQGAPTYQITDVLAHDLDMLYAAFTGLEVDFMLEECSFPPCAELTFGGVRYEVFEHVTHLGRTYQRLLGDNGKIIMCKEDRRRA